MAATASYNAVPSMLTVAPTGMTKRVTRPSIPILSSVLIVTGIVAELKTNMQIIIKVSNSIKNLSLSQFPNVSYLDPVPKAVAKFCPICEMYPYGDLLVHMKKIAPIVINPWMNSPNMTVQKYAPNLPTIIANESISMILATTKKNTPSGESLQNKMIRFIARVQRRFSHLNV